MPTPDKPRMAELLAHSRRADTFLARLLGLMGRRVAPEDGLWIVPCSRVHTFFMRCAIDVIFLDARGKILHVEPDCGPWRVVSCKGAQSVLELPAGACARRGLAPGTGDAHEPTHPHPEIGRPCLGRKGRATESCKPASRTCQQCVLPVILALVLCACAPVRGRDPAIDALAAADAAYKKGEYAEARDQYERLARVIPGDAHALFRLGNIAAHDGDLEAAVHFYREALLRDARHARAMHNLARIEIVRARALLAAASQSATDADFRLQSMALAQALEILLRPKVSSGDPPR